MISGYPKDEMEDFDKYSLIDFLQKPFSSKDLYKRIDSLLQKEMNKKN
jgi:FixJ family two-component response regulator